MKEQRKGISGSTIKIIAVAAMLIDHLAAVVLTRILMQKGMMEIAAMDMQAQLEWLTENAVLYYLMMFMRLIGRLGFPLFCFLLVEGFHYTKSRRKYAINLGIFALVSEVPFDLATSGKILEFHYQNVYFTLLVGLLVLCAIDFAEKKADNKVLRILSIIGITALGFTAAMLLKTDYSGFGVLTIVVMYLLRKKKVLSMLGGCITLNVMSLSEITAFFAMIPIALYNGKRGLKMKYFFYLFYPVHLFILWLIALAMGMGWISAIG